MRKILNEELGRLSEEAFKNADKYPIRLILDNVRSMHNVGSAFRTSDALAIEQIILCGITARPPHRDINKAALGATETVDWSYEENTLNAVQQAQQEGYKVLCVEQVEGAHSLQKFTWKKEDKIALVFGHEVKGVSQVVVNASDGAIEIPQFGTKHSFNISVSLGIVVWSLIQQNL